MAAQGIDKVVILAMYMTPRQARFQLVNKEVECIQTVFANVSITMDIKLNSTKAKALKAILHHSIVQFTCRRYSKEDLSQSSLLFEDGPLTIADLTSLNIDSAKFVLLSACHFSARRNVHFLDEGINLLSAIQFAEFPSVVGT